MNRPAALALQLGIGAGLVGIVLVPGASVAATLGAVGVLVAPVVRRRLGTRAWGLLVTPIVLGLGLAGVLDPSPSALPAAVGGALAALLVHSRWAREDDRDDRVTVMIVALALVLAGASGDAAIASALVLAWLPCAAVVLAAGRSPPGRAASRSAAWGLAVGVAAALLGGLTPSVAPRPAIAVSAPGLDDELDLGAFDALTRDGTVVATVRVEAGAPETLYLRGGAWDTFDARRWLRSGPEPRLRVAGATPEGLAMRVSRAPLDPPVVLDAGVRPTVAPRTGSFVRSADGTAIGASLAPGAVAYDLFALPPFAPDGRTVIDVAAHRLPELLVPESRALLDFVAAARARDPDADAVARLIRALARDFRWTDHPGDRGVDDPVAAFLARGTGTCAHFASALALALRVEGLPTRVITGYAHGERVDDQTIVFRQRHAHAWVAVRLADGWVEVDPTPAAPAPVAGAAPAAPAPRPVGSAATFGGLGVVGLGVAGLAAVAVRRARRAGARGIERAWSRAVDALEQQGIQVPAGPALVTARGLAHRLGDEGACFVALAAHRQAVVWGGEPEALHLADAEALASRIAARGVDRRGLSS